MASEDKPEDFAYDAIDQLYDTADLINDELQGDELRESLMEVAQLFEWMDNDDKTFFELQIGGGKIDNKLYGVQAAFCKAYLGQMMISVIYFERSFYCIVEEIEEQLHDKRYDIELPDFSRRGACYHCKSYSLAETGGLVCLVLWHAEGGADNAHDDDGATNKEWLDIENNSMPGNVNVRGPGYGQTYCILKPIERNDAATGTGMDEGHIMTHARMNRVMFRFGNWCYSGKLNCESLQPHLREGRLNAVVPALQKQQVR